MSTLGAPSSLPTGQAVPPNASRFRDRFYASRAPWLAWSLAFLSLSLTAIGLLLLFITRATPTPPAFGFRGFTSPFAIFFATTGAIIATRHARNPIGWIFCWFGLQSAVQLLAGEYPIYSLLAHPGSLPGGEFMAWVGGWIWVLFIGPIGTFLFLLFPDGRLPSRRWRPVAWLAVGAIAVEVLTLALAPGPLQEFSAVDNPFGNARLAGILNVSQYASLFLAGLMAASVASLVRRWRRARGDERQQIRWFAYAATIFVIPLTASFFELAFFKTFEGLDTLLIIASLGIPVATSIAILKYRLYDIDLVINQTLVYGSLSAILAGVYVAATGVFQRIFVAATGRESEATLVLTTLTVVALFTPIKNRLQLVVDRRFKEASDPATRLRRFYEQVRGVVQVMDAEGIMRRLLEQSVAAFEAEGGAVYVQRNGRLTLLSTSGAWNDQVSMSVPLAHAGAQLGLLTLGPRRGGRDYSPDDREVLDRTVAAVGEALALTRRIQPDATEAPSS